MIFNYSYDPYDYYGYVGALILQDRLAAHARQADQPSIHGQEEHAVALGRGNEEEHFGAGPVLVLILPEFAVWWSVRGI